MLEQMGIQPESSHHESGPGQNEIDFRYSAPLTAADNAVTFHAVVRTAAAQNGLCASFSPKPLADRDGNGMHINVSVKCDEVAQPLPGIIAGILAHIRDMTLFMNPCEESYRRLGHNKAPLYVTWSAENRSQLIRIPAAVGEYRRAELRSADPMANPYIAYALLIYAGMHRRSPPEALYLEADHQKTGSQLHQRTGPLLYRFLHSSFFLLFLSFFRYFSKKFCS